MTDLPYTQGQDNLSGLSGFLYIVEMSAVDTATLPSIVSVSDFSISGNIVLQAAKKFGQIYFTLDKGSLDGKSIGSRDGKGLEFVIKGKYPRLDKAYWLWLRSILNGPLLLIFQQRNTGKKYVMGLTNVAGGTALNVDIPVYFEDGEFKTGEAPGDESGGTMMFKWISSHGPIEYNGTIDLTP